jgi:hypothetical protein
MFISRGTMMKDSIWPVFNICAVLIVFDAYIRQIYLRSNKELDFAPI